LPPPRWAVLPPAPAPGRSSGARRDKALARIGAETRRASPPARITGADGRVLGIDRRPQHGRLHSITDRGQSVTIDPASGRAMKVSRLAIPFEHGGRIVLDVNPVANRLRSTGVSGVNLRATLDTGEARADGTLRYAAGTPLAGMPPRITAGARINGAARRTATAPLTFDPLVGSCTLKAPPNNGAQQPRDLAGVSLPPGIASDILSGGQANRGVLLAAATLNTLGLDSGALAALGPVAGLPAPDILDIAAMR
jgi:hypothetical protein